MSRSDGLCKQCGTPLPDQFVIVPDEFQPSSPPPQPPSSSAPPQSLVSSLETSNDVNAAPPRAPFGAASTDHNGGASFTVALEQRARQAEGEAVFFGFLFSDRFAVIAFNARPIASLEAEAPASGGGGGGSATSRVPKRKRVCATCHFEICGQLDADLKAERLRLTAYRATLDAINAGPVAAAVSSSTRDSAVALEARERDLVARQSELIRVLDGLLAENQRVRAQASQRVAALERAYARERALERELFEKRERWAAFQSSLAAAQLAATMREAEVRELKRVRVYLDLFPIVQCELNGVVTNVMSIGGQRLGRLPGMTIDWEEINAALGECALLLDNIAAVAGAPSVRARVIPLGSRSLVQQLLQPGVKQADDKLDPNNGRVFALYGNDERAAFASSATLVSSVAGFLTSVTSRFLSMSPASTKQAVSTSALISSRRGVDTTATVPAPATTSSDAGAGSEEPQPAREPDSRTEFDCAIALLLCCVDDVAQFIRRSKPAFSNSWKAIEVVPNSADDRGTVAEGVPVVQIGSRKARASRADMKEWTHAMKYMLHNLLQLLAVVSVSSNGNKPR